MARNDTGRSVAVNVGDSLADGAFIEDGFLVNQAVLRGAGGLMLIAGLRLAFARHSS